MTLDLLSTNPIHYRPGGTGYDFGYIYSIHSLGFEHQNIVYIYRGGVFTRIYVMNGKRKLVPTHHSTYKVIP